MTLARCCNQNVIAWNTLNPAACSRMIGVSVDMAVLDRVESDRNLRNFVRWLFSHLSALRICEGYRTRRLAQWQ